MKRELQSRPLCERAGLDGISENLFLLREYIAYVREEKVMVKDPGKGDHRMLN